MPRSAYAVPVLLLALVLPVSAAAAAAAGPQVPGTAIDGPWGSRSPEAAAPTRTAFGISRDDGNDVKGDLDLASMKISRGKAKDTIAFSTHDPVSNTAIDPENGNFAVLIDTNDDRKYDFGQYVFFAAGRIRGLLVNLRTDRVVDRTAPTSRSSAKAFRTSIVRSKIDSPGTYRFVLFGYNQAGACTSRNPCVDTIPNRFPLIALDHRPPTVSLDPMETYSGDVSAFLTSPLSFSFSDDQFGTGVKRWIVQRKRAGSGGSWDDVKSGTIVNPTVNVPGAQGLTYDVRVLVIDKQKNQKVSSMRRTTFPFDDDAASYDAGVVAEASPAGWFLATRTGIDNTMLVPATFTFSGPVGTHVCVMGGPVGSGTASASVDLDGDAQANMNEDVNTGVRERVGCFDTAQSASPHVLTITGVDAATFWIDGFYVVP